MKQKITFILCCCLALCGCTEDASSTTTDVTLDTTTADTPDTTPDTTTTTTDTTPDAPDTDPPPKVTPADFCVPQAEILCERAFACSCPTPEGAQSEASCVENQTQTCLDSFTQALDGLASGQLVLLADEIQRCNEALTAAISACDLPSNEDMRGACALILSSAEPLGGPCQFPICGSGEGACVEGLCAPLPGLGEPCPANICEGDARCIEGMCQEPVALNSPCLFSSACPYPARCVEGTCQTRKSINSPCSTDYECDVGLRCTDNACADVRESFCASPDSCGENASCFGTASRVCVARGTDGATCTYTEDCADGFYCFEGACEANPGESEVCADGVHCAEGLGCGFESGVCSALPTTGEACALGFFGPTLCADGLTCLNGVCGALPTENEPCAMNNACAEGFGCDFKPDAQGNSSICRVRKPEGAECENDDICAAGLFCDYNVGACAPFYALDDLCRLGNECGPGRSCMPITEGARTFTCQALPGEGDPCFLDCAIGTRCQTVEVQAECAPLICHIAWP